MTVDEAIKELHRIRRECPDINFRVITVNDIVDAVLGGEADLTHVQEEEARELARNSWEMKKWPDMRERDWDFLSYAFTPDMLGLED